MTIHDKIPAMSRLPGAIDKDSTLAMQIFVRTVSKGYGKVVAEPVLPDADEQESTV